MRPADLRRRIADAGFRAGLAEAFRTHGDPPPAVDAPLVVSYVRHKPDVGTLLGLDGPDGRPLGYVRFLAPGEAAVSVAKHGGGDDPGWVAHLPEHEAAFFRFPRDRRVRGLRAVVDVERLKHLVHAVVDGFAPDAERVRASRSRVTILRYKPERRGLVRADLATKDARDGTRRTRRMIAQAYADDDGATVRRVMERLVAADGPGERVGCPRPLGWDPVRRVLLQEWVEGAPLGMELDGPRAAAGCTFAGAAVRALASVRPPDGLPDLGPAALFDRAGRVLADLAAVGGGALGAAAAALADELGRAATRLERGPAVLVHGDFHYHQVLVGGPSPRLIDWDEAGVGDPRTDAGNFLAHLHLREVEGTLDADPAARLRAAFTDAWTDGAAPPAGLSFFVAAHLVLLAMSPFRTLRAEWEDEAAAILERARARLAVEAGVAP